MQKNQTVTTVPADAYRAFASALEAGFTGTFDSWFKSDDGKTAMLAFTDQQNAAHRSARMANSKAIWRDLKAFGTIASSKGIAAAMAELEYLQGLDLENLEPTEESPVSTRKRAAKDTEATDESDEDDATE